MEKIKSTPRYLLCCGDVNDISTHGGLPYNLLESSKDTHLLDTGISLKTRKLIPLKLLWNLRQLLIYRNYGGFQYSELFSKNIIRQSFLDKNIKLNILSIAPFLPHYKWSDNWSVDFYIDATNKQIFEDYKKGININNIYKNNIFHREKIAYKRARRIICRSQWAADSISNDYKIDSNKIFVVPGGANIDESILGKLNSIQPLEPTIKNPLRLGFIGIDWERKGGPFLIKLAKELLLLNIPVEIRVIGPDPNYLPKLPFIKPLGFIDKKKDVIGFCNELMSWHFGTLFSEAEAFGISNRECLFLGVPVICHDVGGISSTVLNDSCGNLFKAYPKANSVADWIKLKIYPYTNYLELRSSLSKMRLEFSWKKSILQLKDILD